MTDMQPKIIDDGRVRVGSLKVDDVFIHPDNRRLSQVCGKRGRDVCFNVMGDGRTDEADPDTLVTPLDLVERKAETKEVPAAEIDDNEYCECDGGTVYRAKEKPISPFVTAARERDGARCHIPREKLVTPLTMTRPAEFRRGR